MNQIINHAAACVVCGSSMFEVLDLGRQPLANQLLQTPTEEFPSYRLGLAACPSCSHGQLTQFVDPADLFTHYLYASGTSGTLNSYFEWFSRLLSQSLPPGARVLEIACNDGSLLAKLSAHGCNAVGVDPAENLTAIARARGLNVLTGFFPRTAPDGMFDAVVAMNVLAHTPRPSDILSGIKNSLSPAGVAFVQTSQAMMLEDGQFDTIYHEHCSFFTPRSMSELCRRSGLRLDRIILTSVHGGSAVFVFRHVDAPPSPDYFIGDDSFLLPQQAAARAAVFDYPQQIKPAYRQFARMAENIMSTTREAVTQHRRAGRSIALTGVAAKSMTFIRAAEIEPDHYLDEAELKIGRFVPGTGKKIEAFERAKDLPDDTVFLIGAWNFAPEIRASCKGCGQVEHAGQ